MLHGKGNLTAQNKKTLRRPGSVHGPRWGSLQRSRRPPSWWEGLDAGCPSPRTPSSALGPSGLASYPHFKISSDAVERGRTSVESKSNRNHCLNSSAAAPRNDDNDDVWVDAWATGAHRDVVIAAAWSLQSNEVKTRPPLALNSSGSSIGARRYADRGPRPPTERPFHRLPAVRHSAAGFGHLPHSSCITTAVPQIARAPPSLQ